MNELRVLAIAALVAAVLGLATCLIANTAVAQSYPSRPIRLIVAYPPGGGTDTFARIVALKLTELAGQRVIVDNRSGAAGNIGYGIAARAQPDGYTLLWGFSTPLVVNPSLYKNLPFDSEKDFAPIAFLGSAQYLLVVHSSVQANSLQDLIVLLKSKPGQFPYGSPGIGSPNHLAGELFKGRAGVDIIHVAYKGGGAVALAVLSGEVKILFGSFASSLPHVKAGSVKALAVTGPKRSHEVPSVPTMQESGLPGFDVRAWYGVLAPAGTPKAIVTRLNHDLLKLLSMPEVQEALKRAGFEPSGSTPEDFAAYIKSEKTLWAKVIKDADIKPE
ncbi:MAG: tripartite tricarboxylate transporter substrate binding protein [Betaproteobacteria bacterium]|nr:tripartite tricarboxylate transporter substrate binding protein [Betaproteobacteria bacterium]